MNVDYVNPFILGVYDLFANVLEAKVERATGQTLDDDDSTQLVALIGISGKLQGFAAFVFPDRTAQNMVNQLLHTVQRNPDKLVARTINVMALQVADQAAKHFPSNGSDNHEHFSAPAVVRGQRQELCFASETEQARIDFGSDLGPFFLLVALEPDSASMGG